MCLCLWMVELASDETGYLRRFLSKGSKEQVFCFFVFFLKVFIALPLTLRSDPFLFKVSVWCEVEIQIDFLHVDL